MSLTVSTCVADYTSSSGICFVLSNHPQRSTKGYSSPGAEGSGSASTLSRRPGDCERRIAFAPFAQNRAARPVRDKEIHPDSFGEIGDPINASCVNNRCVSETMFRPNSRFHPRVVIGDPDNRKDGHEQFFLNENMILGHLADNQVGSRRRTQPNRVEQDLRAFADIIIPGVQKPH